MGLVHDWLRGGDSRRGRLTNNRAVRIWHHYIWVTQIMSKCRALLVCRGANMGWRLYMLLGLYRVWGLVHHDASHLWRSHCLRCLYSLWLRSILHVDVRHCSYWHTRRQMLGNLAITRHKELNALLLEDI